MWLICYSLQDDWLKGENDKIRVIINQITEKCSIILEERVLKNGFDIEEF